MGLDMFLYRWPKVEGINYAKALDLLHMNLAVPRFVSASAELPRKPYYGQFNLEAETGVKGSNVLLKKGKYNDYGVRGEKAFDHVPEIGYWRKDYELHDWLVANVQGGVDDCGYYEVSRSHLEALLADVQGILSRIRSMPRGYGDDDDSRKKALKRTERIVKSALRQTKWDKEVITYHASW